MYTKYMENLSYFDVCLQAIDNRTQENFVVQQKMYEQLYDALKDIVQNNFTALANSLAVVPFGDYLMDTYYDNSIVDFYIVYKINRSEVDFSVVDRKQSKKGSKVSLYSSIMNAPVVTGTIQAEQIASQLKNFLMTKFNAQKMFQKRNQIILKLTDVVNARITICYDLGEQDDLLTVRKVNIWKNINLTQFFNNIEKKEAETNQNFHKIVRIFKALEVELIIQGQSNVFIGKNYFVENLLYNVPSQIFLGENLEIVSKSVLTYLNNKDYKTFELIDKTGKMFEQDFYSKKYEKQFINKINYALETLPNLLNLTE